MINVTINNISMEFETNNNVFSPQNIDKGTLAMLSQVIFSENDKVLDLGCGYGVVGILAAKLINPENITMCDISDEAIYLSKKNIKLNNVDNIKIIKSNGLDNILDNSFTMILSNPPYHVDFSVPKNFIEKGYKKLLVGGKMYMVTKRKQWYKNKMISIFGGVKITEIDDYYVFMAQKFINKKLDKQKNNNLSKKLNRKLKLQQKKYSL